MMKLLALALALALVPACLAKASTTKGTTNKATHQPGVNYYAVSQPVYAFDSTRASSVIGVGPAQDQGVYDQIPSANGRVPENALLQLMDANDADLAQGYYDPGNNADMRWFPRSNSSFGAKSFIHKTRCFNGQTGTTVQSSIGKYYYKKCPNTNTALFVGKTFRIAPFLCEESCDKDATCVGYVVDGAGQNCWTLVSTTLAHSSYYRISDAATPSSARQTNSDQAEQEANASSDYYHIIAPAYIPLNYTYVSGSTPVLDQPVSDLLFGIIPEEALLEIMDANGADFGANSATHGAGLQGGSSLNWLPRSNTTFAAQVFIHKSRCNTGNGVTVREKKGNGYLYKKCTRDYTNLEVLKTFNVAPFLCQQTCDNDSSCTAYMVDGAGENCWIAGHLPQPKYLPPRTSYYRISDD
jgi:hypothetical protein